MPAINCPDCKAAVDVANGDMGKVVECEACGKWFPAGPTPIHIDDLDAPTGHFSCPYCHCSELPTQRTQVMRLGWWLCFILILSCFGSVLCWVPLLIFREEIRKCAYCGMRLDYPRPIT